MHTCNKMEVTVKVVGIGKNNNNMEKEEEYFHSSSLHHIIKDAPLFIRQVCTLYSSKENEYFLRDPIIGHLLLLLCLRFSSPFITSPLHKTKDAIRIRSSSLYLSVNTYYRIIPLKQYSVKGKWKEP